MRDEISRKIFFLQYLCYVCMVYVGGNRRGKIRDDVRRRGDDGGIGVHIEAVYLIEGVARFVMNILVVRHIDPEVQGWNSVQDEGPVI